MPNLQSISGCKNRHFSPFVQAGKYLQFSLGCTNGHSSSFNMQFGKCLHFICFFFDKSAGTSLPISLFKLMTFYSILFSVLIISLPPALLNLSILFYFSAYVLKNPSPACTAPGSYTTFYLGEGSIFSYFLSIILCYYPFWNLSCLYWFGLIIRSSAGSCLWWT